MQRAKGQTAKHQKRYIVFSICRYIFLKCIRKSVKSSFPLCRQLFEQTETDFLSLGAKHISNVRYQEPVEEEKKPINVCCLNSQLPKILPSLVKPTFVLVQTLQLQ